MTTTANIESKRLAVSTRAPATIRDEVDDVVSRFFGGQGGWFTGRMFLFVDITESDQALEVTVDIPGVDPGTLAIELAGNVLTVRGERLETKNASAQVTHRVERRKGAVSRSISLPCAVADEEATAEFKDGVLTIILPKCDALESRSIEVRHKR